MPAEFCLRNQDLVGLRRVFGAKVSGLELWTSTAALQPACCQVLFSSVSSLLGSPGQANYAAANAVLDAAAAACAQRGSPVLSVQWGAWAGGGMAAQDKQTAARVERTGMALIQPERGLAALSGVLGAAGGWSGRRASRRVVGDEG